MKVPKIRKTKLLQFELICLPAFSGYLAHYMLSRQLRYSVDSFAAFFRLGAECWGPRSAKPELELKLASEDPVKKEARLKLEEELCSKAIKRKENLALYRVANRAKHFAQVQARREAKQKAANGPTKAAQQPKKAATKAKKAAQKPKKTKARK